MRLSEETETAIRNGELPKMNWIEELLGEVDALRYAIKEAIPYVRRGSVNGVFWREELCEHLEQAIAKHAIVEED